MVIYYDSKTGNVKRFIERVGALTHWKCVRVSDTSFINEKGHLVTYTTKIGSVPETTTRFMKEYNHLVLSVSSSGNMNWGVNFALAAEKIAVEYFIPVLLKFELSGLDQDVDSFIQKVKEYADKKMDSPQ